MAFWPVQHAKARFSELLFDGRYAIGDSVDLGGLSGEVVVLGVLSTRSGGCRQPGDDRAQLWLRAGGEPHQAAAG